MNKSIAELFILGREIVLFPHKEDFDVPYRNIYIIH